MINIQDKSIDVLGLQTNYIDYIPSTRFKTVLLIAPGLMDSTFFKKFIPGFPNYYRFIAPDLPSRGKTEKSDKFNTIDSLSDFCIEFMNKVIGKSETYCIFSISYGTAVATEIVKKAGKRIDTVVLGGAGEYLDQPLKTIGKLALLPALINDDITKSYITILAKIFPILKEFPKDNGKSLALQYMSALNYKITFTEPSNTKAVIVNFNMDDILAKDSYRKLYKFYPNYIFIPVEIEHVLNDENTTKIMNDVLPKVIKTLNWKM